MRGKQKEGRKYMFYLMTHSTHFIYGYMASDIWLRTILIVRKETRCRHIGYSFRLTAKVLLYAPSHRQDSTYHSLCYTSLGALAGMRNNSMGPPHEVWQTETHHWTAAVPSSPFFFLGRGGGAEGALSGVGAIGRHQSLHCTPSLHFWKDKLIIKQAVLLQAVNLAGFWIWIPKLKWNKNVVYGFVPFKQMQQKNTRFVFFYKLFNYGQYTFSPQYQWSNRRNALYNSAADIKWQIRIPGVYAPT